MVFEYMGLDTKKPAFGVHLLESIVSKVNTSKISIFYLVSIAEQVVLSMTWSETPKTDFVTLETL